MSFTKVKIVIMVLIACAFSVTLNAEFTKEMATGLVLNQICGDKLDQVNIYSAKVTRSSSQIDIFRGYDEPIQLQYSSYYLYYVDNTPEGFHGGNNEYIAIEATSGEYQIFTSDFCPDDMRPHDYLSNYDLIHYVFNPVDYYTSRVEFIENTSESRTINNNAYAVIIKPRFNDDLPGTEITHFWNDVSFIYSTLKMKGYSDNNIILLYDNDGVSEYGNDFDGDYNDDIDFACTEPNINIVFEELAGFTNNYPEIQELDQNNSLSFFSVGVGMWDAFGNPLDKVIYCWNAYSNPPGTQEYIFPEELSEMLSNVNCGYMNIVLGQDYSGNFVEDIVDNNNNYNYLCDNRAIITSTGIDQCNKTAPGGWSVADYSAEAWITDHLYSEFFYYYISAVRGYYPFIEFQGTTALSTTPWLDGYETGEFPYNLSGFPHTEDFDFAVEEGAGIRTGEGIISNCTIVNNRRGVCYSDWEHLPTIKNSIVYDNQMLQVSGLITNVTYSDIQGGFTGTGNINADPLFVDPSNGDYQLTQLSPCIDTGDPTYPNDPDGSLPDMGCYPYLHDYDTKHFSPGWQWPSFPVLTQQFLYTGSYEPLEDEMYEQAYDENGFNGFLQDPVTGELSINGFLKIEGKREFLMDIQYIDYEFQDNLFGNMLFRQEGYKIFVEGTNTTTLIVDGDRLPANHTIDGALNSGEYHWLGFWIPRTQNMIESFGNFWQYVEKVKSEEWFYSPANNQRGGDPTYPVAISAEGLTLEYGKAYLVLFNEQVEGFHWTDTSITVETEKKSEPENFTYTEKADYEAVDVFNIPPNVTEIGVFEDDLCVGAVVVEDTCAQILVYSDNANRDPIPFTFEIVTGRGFSTPVKDYQILNLQTGKYEIKSIFSGRQEYSIMRFADEGESEDNTLTTPRLYGNYPNPFNPTTTISFSLPNEQKIDLTVYNIKGQKVKQLIGGQLTAGQHSMIWDGKDTNGKSVSTGIYFYKLKTGKKEISRKMLLLRGLG